MTLTLLLGGAALAAAMGIYDAYANKRGAVGWIISIVASLVGGVAVGAFVPQAVIMALKPSDSAVLWVGLVGVLAGVLIGSSLLLRLVNRVR